MLHSFPRTVNGVAFSSSLRAYALKEDGLFLQPQETTPVYAQLKYHIRGTTLYEAYLKMQDYGNDPLEAIEGEVKRSIRLGVNSPFNSIHEMQRYVSSLVFSTPLPPTTLTSPDHMVITYCGISLSVIQWRNALKQLVRETHAEIKDILGDDDYGVNIPDLPKDDWTETRRNYSWMEAGPYVPNPQCLLENLVTQKKLVSKDSDGNVLLKTPELWDLLNKLSRVTKLIIWLCYFTPGGVARVSEFWDHKITNGDRPRTIFRHGSFFWFVTRRTKPESLTGRASFILTQMCPEVCRFLNVYFTLLKPLESDIVHLLKGERCAQITSQFLCVQEGEHIPCTTLLDWIHEFMRDYCMVGAGAREYRHFVVEISRLFIGSAGIVDEDDTDTTTAQRGHSGNTARTRYAIEEGQLPSISSDIMNEYANSSSLWWQFCDLRDGYPPLQPIIARRRIRDTVANAPIEGSNPSMSRTEIMELVSAVIAKQQQDEFQRWSDDLQKKVISTVLELLPYIRNSTLGSGALPLTTGRIHVPSSSPDLASMDRVGDLTHATNLNSTIASATLSGSGFSERVPDRDSSATTLSPALGTPLTSSCAPSSPLLTVKRIAQPAISSMPLEYLSTPEVSGESLLSMLQRVFRHVKNPRFKSETQKKMCLLAIERQHNFVCVLPTGGGKSLVFLLPTFCEYPMVPIVVIPNRALLNDQLRKATSFGIKALKWTTDITKIPDGYQIVFAALESVTSPKFSIFYTQNRPLIARIVIDESHQALTMQTFRTKFQALSQLTVLDVQKVFITGTLPVGLEEAFFREMSLPSHTIVLRAPSHQLNISYHIVGYSKKNSEPISLISAAIRLLNRHHFLDGRKIIILCPNISLADRIANRLGPCAISHSNRPEGTKDEKERLWFEGHYDIMVATNGFSQGVDAPNVGLVIYVDHGYGLINIIQGMGRAARDGNRAIGLYFRNLDASGYPTKSHNDYECLEDAQRWLETKQCRRLILSEVMDGRAQSCTDLDAVPCDICSPDDPITQGLKALTTNYDDGGLPDQFLMDVDLSAHAQPTLAPPHYVLQTVSPAQGSSMPPIRHHISNTPSTHVLMDAANAAAPIQELQRKVQVLNNALHQTRDCCVICWVVHRTKIPPHQNVKEFFSTCFRKGSLQDMTGWLTMKKTIRLPPPLTYCFACGIPARPYRPFHHGDLMGTDQCLFNRWTILIVWTIWLRDDIRVKARNAFADMPERQRGNEVQSRNDLQGWYSRVRGEGCFYNGLEVAIWFCEQRAGGLL